MDNTPERELVNNYIMSYITAITTAPFTNLFSETTLTWDNLSELDIDTYLDVLELFAQNFLLDPSAIEQDYSSTAEDLTGIKSQLEETSQSLVLQQDIPTLQNMNFFSPKIPSRDLNTEELKSSFCKFYGKLFLFSISLKGFFDTDDDAREANRLIREHIFKTAMPCLEKKIMLAYVDEKTLSLDNVPQLDLQIRP